jgi:hypothetical protein
LARGLAGNFTGTRANIIICDDVEVPNTTGTAAKREQLRQRLADINFVLVPSGLQLYVGTPHSYYSIYADRPRLEIGEEKPFLDSFERLCLPLVMADGSSAWPERFPSEAIDDLQRIAGPQRFRSQMMLTPTPPQAVARDPDRMLPYAEQLTARWSQGRLVLTLAEREMVSSVCWWDPAYGSPNRGDRSAIALVMMDSVGHYWLHALRYLRFAEHQLDQVDEATQLVRQAIEFAASYNQTRLTIETNGIGRFLPALVRREMQRSNYKLSVIERTSKRAKVERILSALDPVLAAGHLHIHQSLMNSGFVEEMREWTAVGASFDDGLDAVSNAILEHPNREGFASGRHRGSIKFAGDFLADSSFSV